VQPHVFGWEVGAGYRFNRYVSVQAEGMFAVSGGFASMQPQLDPTADLRTKNFIRPAIRADLPLARYLSVYATYGMQLEDMVATTHFPTGGTVTYTSTNTCDTNDPNCKVTTTVSQSPEYGTYKYHYRDLRPAATVGFDLFGTDATSLHMEYLPKGNGRVGSITAGASWHW
jgi:hypothetical protein